MATDGTTFEVGIGVEASGVEGAATSLAKLAERLTAAGAASTAASEAVKAGEAAYAQAESAADRAAKAVEKVGVEAAKQRGKLEAALKVGEDAGIEKAAAKLNALTMRQTELIAKSEAAKAAVVGQATALDKLKASASGAADAEAKLGKASAAATKAADATKKATAAAGGSGKVNEMAEAFGRLGGPLGRVGQQAFGAADGVKKLVSSLGTTGGPYALAAIAAVALSTAILAGVTAMAAFGIANADGARSASLLAAGVAGSVSGGMELDDTIHKLGTSVPQTRDELLKMAGELAKTGLKGDALADALETAAIKAAKLKYGPDFAKQTLSLTSQAARLRDNISGPKGIFSGLQIESLLVQFGSLVALFDSTSVTGKAIRAVFESLFQPLIDGLVGMIPKIVSTFIQFEIWVLKAMIAVKPFGSTFVLIAQIIGVAALVVGVALAAVVVVIVAMAAAAAILVGGLAYLGMKLTGLVIDATLFAATLIAEPGKALDWLRMKFDAVVAFLSGLSLGDIGKAMIDGLVAGIMGAGGAVLSAMTGVVNGAIDGAKKALGIASPSKVFAEIGMNTGAGMTAGVETSAGDVQGALESMVAPPDAGGGTAGAPAAPAAGGGGSYAGATFNFYGVEGAEDALDRFVRVISGDDAQLGRAVPT